jgi:hypothetical protein
VLEDPSLPHQIVILLQPPGPRIAVSCTCRSAGTGANGKRSTTTGGHRAIGIRSKWETGEAYACWLGHMAEIGAEVA